MTVLQVLYSVGKWSLYVLMPLGVLRAIYNIFLHPLRSYPGPLLARLTDAYGGFWAMKNDLHLATYHNLQIYGPVIRQAPNRLTFNSLEALNDIYLSPIVGKGQAYRDTYIRSKFPSLLMGTNKARHRTKRKLLMPVFSERSMRKLESKIKAHVDIFLHNLLLSSQRNEVVDISEATRRLGIDVIGELSFGQQLKTQTEKPYRIIYEGLEFMIKRFNVYMQLPALNVFDPLFVLFNYRYLLKLDTTIKKIISIRMAEEKNAHDDLYSLMINSLIQEQGQDTFRAGELWTEAIMFLGAGGLTTATAMSATLFYLSRNPKCYAKLASEIRSTFASDKEICTDTKLSGCKYLRACIDEAMRMSPPFLPHSWRQQDDDEPGPFIVAGKVIPRGTQVAISPYALFHNEEYFSDPFTYAPERWLPPPEGVVETEEEQAARATMRKVFAPFLVGERNCPGKNMAYLEASLTLARIFWFFNFETAPGEVGKLGAGRVGGSLGRQRPDEYQLGDIFVTDHHGPNLMFKTRGDLWKELQ